MSETAMQATEQDQEKVEKVGLLDAFLFWLKLGFISFGGPAGQISIMHQELVERRRWISERRFLHALNYCMLLPGPEAQQLATYIGWLMHRTWGGVIAGALFVLPSLFILIALSWVYIAFGEVPVVAGLFYGIKPAVTAIVVQAAHRIGSRALKNNWLWVIAAASFVAIFALNLPFPLIVLGAAMIGYLGGRYAPDKFSIGGGHGASKQSYGPALIDDDTPPPAHARFRWSRSALLAAVGVVLWALPMGLLTALYGWDDTLTQMGWFFTKAALLTFGGAYAVLPYVYQGAVGHYGWLTPTQMIDGLALGETTRATDHGRGLRGLRWRICASGLWAGTGIPCRRCGSQPRNLVYLPALVPVHPRRRAAGGVDPQRIEVYGTTDRHHCRGGWRHPQPSAVLRLSRAVA